jgi:hypothetical protein
LLSFNVISALCWWITKYFTDSSLGPQNFNNKNIISNDCYNEIPFSFFVFQYMPEPSSSKSSHMSPSFKF